MEKRALVFWSEKCKSQKCNEIMSVMKIFHENTMKM